MKLSFGSIGNASTCILLIILFIVGSSLGYKVSEAPRILLANSADVRLVSLDNPNKSEIIATKLSQAGACDYVYSEKLVFWIDSGKIQCTNTSDVHRTKFTIAESAGEQPDGLACDWIGKKLYWSDAKSKRIKVSELDGSSKKVLIWGNLDQPRAIAVDPHTSFMYWTDWGEIPKIERAGMDGTKRQTLINEDIYWPNGITLDYKEGKVYWVEANYHAIYRMNMDGSGREVVVNENEIRQSFLPENGILSSSPLTTPSLPSDNADNPNSENSKLLGALQHPFAISLYEDRIYWTDWATNSLQSMLKNGSGIPRIIKKENIYPMDLQVYSSKRQKAEANPCGHYNGGCSHLCLLSPDPPYYRCTCPTGVKINPDRKTCSDGPREFLLVARRSDLRLISLDTRDYSDVVIPTSKVLHAVAITFDPVDQFVYWTDDEIKAIFRSHLNGSDSQVIVTDDVEGADGIAVDWVARNLYWTDGGKDYIAVSRLNGTMKKILIETGIDEPRAITLDPVGGRMYWSDWGEKSKIEKANLDGSDRVVLVENGIEWPNGLALDSSNERLFWADARMDRIEVINVDGTGRRVLLSNDLPHIFGLSLLGDYLYWSDSQRRCIERMLINRRQSRETIQQFPDLFGLEAASLTIPPGSNPCAVNNGGCSHLCLYTPQGVRCHCPTGLELAPSLTDCFIPEAFLLMSFTNFGGIRKLPLDSARANTEIPFKTRVDASFMDFSVKDSQIYWTDTKKMVIMRSMMNGSSMERFVDIGVEILEGVAVDWIGRNMFWADSSNNRIEAMQVDTRSRRLIVYKGIDSPRCLALDPDHGHIYWSEWGSIPRIKRASMDGSNIVQINRGTTGRANSLTIDYEAHRLYWVDYEINTIVSSDMNGDNVRDVVCGDATMSISSLTLYGEYVYWSDSKRRAIMRANKMNGINQQTIKSELNDVDDIVIYHASRQSGVTSCANGNGGCEHMCLSLPEGKKTCTCPTHYVLNDDNRTCTAPSNFLLVSQSRYITRIIFQSPGSEVAVVPGRGRTNSRSHKYNSSPGPDAVVPISGIEDACSIDFDPISNRLLWIDCKLAQIKSSKPDGSETLILFRNNATNYQPYDIAVDVYSRFLYWTDATTNSIRLMTLDGAQLGVILSEKVKSFGKKEFAIRPRKLAVDPLRGRLYFSNQCDNPFTCREEIMQSALDGSECIVFMRENLRNITALTVDVALERLYWSDQAKIESSDLDSSNRIILVETGLTKPVGLALFGQDLFWIDSQIDGGLLEGANKMDGLNRRKIQSRMKNLRDLVSVVMTDQSLMNHPCSVDNGGCSHICVVNEDRTTRCSCPNHLVLHNHFQCVKPSTCGANEFTCKRVQQCIPLGWVCDKSKECEDESDEEDCFTTPAQCIGRYSCGLGDLESYHPLLDAIPQCIEFSKVCNRETDCLNGRDEKDCSLCQPGEIRCNRKCVLASTCGECEKDVCSKAVESSSELTFTQSVVIGLSVAFVAIVIVVGILCKYCVSHDKSRYANVVMFTTNEHGHFNVEFQSHDNNPTVRSSIMGRRRKPPLLVSIVPPPSGNGSSSQGATSGSGWPAHKDGQLAERPHISGASCTSSLKHTTTGLVPASECYPDDCSSSSGASCHASCSKCKGEHRHRRFRKMPELHAPPPPTPCTTDTCEDFDKCTYRSVDTAGLPLEPPPPYSGHHTCCSYCYHHFNQCHASTSTMSTSSRRHGNGCVGNPPSYERLRNANRRRHYHRHFSGLNSDSDPCPPPPTPRSQYMSEFCDTTEAEEALEVETMTTRIEESEDDETVPLAPSNRSSPSATEMSFSTPLYNPPPSPVSSD